MEAEDGIVDSVRNVDDKAIEQHGSIVGTQFRREPVVNRLAQGAFVFAEPNLQVITVQGPRSLYEVADGAQNRKEICDAGVRWIERRAGGPRGSAGGETLGYAVGQYRGSRGSSADR